MVVYASVTSTSARSLRSMSSPAGREKSNAHDARYRSARFGLEPVMTASGRHGAPALSRRMSSTQAATNVAAFVIKTSVFDLRSKGPRGHLRGWSR